jgi:hypothetical protein
MLLCRYNVLSHAFVRASGVRRHARFGCPFSGLPKIPDAPDCNQQSHAKATAQQDVSVHFEPSR